MTGHPPTKKREAVRLYLTNLNVIRKDIIDKSDLLCFYAKVQTSDSKTRSAYTLIDPGTSHCYIDTAFAKQLGLPFRHAGHMSIITAGTKHPREDRYQLFGLMDGYAASLGITQMLPVGTLCLILRAPTTLLLEKIGTRRHAIWWIQTTFYTSWMPIGHC